MCNSRLDKALIALRLFSSVVMIGLLASCTASSGTSSSSIDSSNLPSSSTPASSASGTASSTGSAPELGDAFLRGKKDYAALCVSCHKGDGSSDPEGSIPSIHNHNCSGALKEQCGNVVKLANYISPNMPFPSSSCTDADGSTCATDVATYIVEAFKPLDANADKDKDKDGVLVPNDKCPNTPKEYTAKVGPTGCSGINELSGEYTLSPQMRLTEAEYVGTIKKAFGVNSIKNVVLQSDTFGPKGFFLTNAVDAAPDLSVLIDASVKITASLADNLAGSCNWEENAKQCVKDHLVDPMKVLFRQNTINNQDIESVADSISIAFSDGVSSQTMAVHAALTRMLLDDRFVYKMEAGDTNGNSDISHLTGDEFASRLAYLLTDLPPDTQLLQAPDNIDTHVERLQATDAYKEVAWQFVRQWLQLPAVKPKAVLLVAPKMGDQCNTTPECQSHFKGLASNYDCANSASNTSVCMCDGEQCNSKIPESNGGVAASAYEESRRFVQYVLTNDVPFTELFTANYSFIDKTLAEFYGIPAPANDWDRVMLPDSAKRRGLLTHASFLTQSGGHGRDLNTIFRGKVMFERLFCRSMPPTPEGVNPVEANKDVDDRTIANGCSHCHSEVDPLGRIFDVYDDEGALIAGGSELSGGITLDVDVFGDYNDYPDMALGLGRSAAVSDCTSRQLYRFALGREAVISDQDTLNEVRNNIESSQSFNEIIKAFVSSDSFRRVHLKSKQFCPVGS